MGRFECADLRGEYWLYTEGSLKVSVGRGAVAGECHFNTSDVHLESVGPLESRKVAEILAQLMTEFGGEPGGYRRLVLHLDGKYDLSADDVALIDRALSGIGFSRRGGAAGKDLLWVRGR
jgi:hypothetical protein